MIGLAVAVAMFFTSLLSVTFMSAVPRGLEEAAVADVSAALAEAIADTYPEVAPELADEADADDASSDED